MKFENFCIKKYLDGGYSVYTKNGIKVILKIIDLQDLNFMAIKGKLACESESPAEFWFNINGKFMLPISRKQGMLVPVPEMDLQLINIDHEEKMMIEKFD